jgi:hypothetical protein
MTVVLLICLLGNKTFTDALFTRVVVGYSKRIICLTFLHCMHKVCNRFSDISTMSAALIHCTVMPRVQIENLTTLAPRKKHSMV